MLNALPLGQHVGLLCGSFVAPVSIILGEANNTDTFTVSGLTSYCHSHRVIPVGLKLLKLSCETL